MGCTVTLYCKNYLLKLLILLFTDLLIKLVLSTNTVTLASSWAVAAAKHFHCSCLGVAKQLYGVAGQFTAIPIK